MSFYDAITGASAMTGALFQVSPLNTFILCVGMRVLMGLCVGLIFSGLKRFDKPGTWSYILSAMCAPALNTLFFMGYIVLAFYGCDYVQNLVSVKGAANPFMFVVLLVGVQGVAEFLVSGILGGEIKCGPGSVAGGGDGDHRCLLQAQDRSGRRGQEALGTRTRIRRKAAASSLLAMSFTTM